jgi:hypothetical protein
MRGDNIYVYLFMIYLMALSVAQCVYIVSSDTMIIGE